MTAWHKKDLYIVCFFPKICYLCIAMMKKITILFAQILLLIACNGIQISERLNHIDSLVVKEQYDSACVILEELNEANMSAEEQAHYYLLKTQLGYLTQNPLPSDSLLDMAFTYYKKVGNHKKLADAYYYKSYRSRINQNYPQAILYCKEAELLAMKTSDSRLQYKIAENLAYLNGLCENNQLQLLYSKKAIAHAQMLQNKNWLAYSYSNLSFAFGNLGQYDSAFFYIEKTIPLINYINASDKAGFLTNIGLLYKGTNSEKAKEYLIKAMLYGELPGTLEHLADIYFAEGNKEEAYKLWKKALKIDSRYEKDNIVLSILSYDLERGNLDETSKSLDEIIAIKDSIITILRNDTIKDLQLRFDHEVTMHEADKKLINTQWMLLGLVVILGIMTLYIFIRRKKEEAMEREHQMQLYAYTTEINQLKANRDSILTQIRNLESHQERDTQRIREREEDAKNAELAIEKLNKDIRKLLDDESPKLKRGRMLYDHIMDGGKAHLWSNKEESLFNNYYGAINYQTYNRLRKVERKAKLSAHNLFYLILKEMGKDDEEIKRIMALSPEGLRSLRNRTKPK